MTEDEYRDAWMAGIPRSMRPFTAGQPMPADIRERVLEMHREEFPREQIAQVLGLSMKSVASVIRGVDRNPLNSSTRERADAIMVMWRKGATPYQIAAKFSCDRRTVTRVILRHARVEVTP